MLAHRRIIVDIDAVLNLFKDYCSPEDIPADAMPVKLLLKPAEMGKLAILAESNDWPANLPPLEVRFQLKRFHAV